ncbi:hypothetical protein GCM10011585_21090 [Edaphobacter dinghuensis]|uniref:Uncharacterized protein n=1 Tax=Edaphobacter dinghuensis TaxID=1560005 RepID=A0A917HGC5_9BACT|nr:hypothetical protein GCM10011585_21090 [Edaphobacter dinghuensis]
MLSVLCGVAVYIVTFALLTFCYRRLKARLDAKRGYSSEREQKEKSRFNSKEFCFLLLCVALAFGRAAARL